MHGRAFADGSPLGQAASVEAEAYRGPDPGFGASPLPSDPSRYGTAGPRPAVLVAIVLFHAALLAALVTMRFHEPSRSVERLTTFSVSEEPPPPQPAEPAPPAEPVEAAAPVMAPVAAPEPAIRTPRRVEIAASAPQPVPLVAPPRPAPAPANPQPPQPAPAPVVPPDFRANQLDNPAPSYPYLSKKAREEGVVLLRVLVSTAGRASRVEIEESSGHERLDETALETVRDKWRFVPASQAGEPVEAWVLVPVTFSLG